MQQTSLHYPISGLKEFNACLLSMLLIMMPFVQLAAAEKRSGATAQKSDRGRQAADGRQQDAANNTGSVAENVFVNAPIPKPAPEPFAVNIVATKDDGLAAAATVAPGGTITYNVTVSNTGSTDAANVQFTDTIDPHTTLVGGSLNTQPIADPDTYTASGNIAISKNAASGVLANDRDPDTGNNSGLTVTEVQGNGANVGASTDTTATGRGSVKGKVTLNSDGSFTYEPPPGFVGADTFTYKISDGTKTDAATVTITMSGMVWFIQNNVGGTNIGTFSNPFTSIASFNTANAGSGVAPDPKNGDFIALRTGTGTYTETDGVNLRAQQKLIGNGVAFNTAFTADSNSIAAYTTFAGSAGSAPNIVTSSGNGVDLSTDNTVRGLNVGNTPGFFKFNGGAVGSPIINTVSLTGTGGALNVSTSGAFGANVTFGTFESTSSPGANVSLVNVTGTLAVTTTGTGLSGSASASAVVNVSGGTMGFTYPGSMSKSSGTGALVSVSGGHNTGTLTFSGTLSATSGTGLQFDNADGTYNFSGTTTINGGNAHIQITNGSAGTFTFSSNTAVTSPSSSPAFDVSGGTASAPNVTYSGTLTQNTASQRAINISGINGGTESFSGAIGSDGGAGVSIEGTGGTVNISGNMTLNNTASIFRACSGICTTPSGTGLHISVTGSNNTVGATNAATVRGVQIDSAQIDAGGVTFKSIAVNGSTTDGITVKNTGNAGFFTVAGNGSAGTGGTIQNITNRGASFITTRNITLNWMTFTSANTADGTASNGTVGGAENTGENGAINLQSAVNVALSNVTINTTAQHGINGNTVTNLDLTNVSISNTGSGVWESGIYLFHLKGVPSASQDSVWDNVDITDTAQFNVSIINASGTNAAGGEKDKLTIQNGSSFKNSGKNVIGDHISNFNSVTANFQIVVNGATFDSKLGGEYVGAHTSDGIQVDVSGASARFDATITGCTFTSTTGGGAGQSAINLSSTTGQGTFSVTNNNATVRQGAGINVAVTGSASLTGHITGNTLATNITNNPSFGIGLVEEGNGSILADVSNNNIQGSGSGIGTTTAFDLAIKAGARAGSGSAQLTFAGNIVQTSKSNGMLLFSGNSTAGETNTVCVNLSTANKNNMESDAASKVSEYELDQYTGTTFHLQGYGGAANNAGQVEAFVLSTDASPAGDTAFASAGTTVNFTNATCSVAPLLLAEGGIDFARLSQGASSTAPIHAQRENPYAALLEFLGGNDQSKSVTAISSSLKPSELDTMVNAAKSRWLRSGLSPQQSTTLNGLTFQISDLADGYLGEAEGNRILVSRDAQGKGWFIDATPADDSEFATPKSATRRYTDPMNAAAGRVDLLTAIEHEIGHKLGLDDSYVEKARDSIMYGYLTVGERRVPRIGEAKAAKPEGLSGVHFLRLEKAEVRAQRSEVSKVGVRGLKPRVKLNHARSTGALTPVVADVTVNIGTLRAGDSVTITFQVTVNNPPNLTLLNPARVENQGTVTADGGISVLTDDTEPTLPGAADKTATRIDLFNTTTSLASNLNPSNFGDQVTFTATVSETPAQAGVDPTGTVDFIDTSNGNAVVCNDVALTAGSAQCQTSSLTAGTHNIRADYSGDGNFDPSQSNVVAQVINACTPNPIVTSTADSGAGTLREALANVCTGNTITFNIAGPGPDTITLTTGELVVGKNATINYTNPTKSLTISGNNLSRVFNINSGKTVSIIGLTISGGNALNGGGVLNDGTLTVINSTLTGNTAGADGAGIQSTASATSVTLINTTISGNTANGFGGGVDVLGGTATIINSTITNNHGDNDNGGGGGAGGLRRQAGTVTLKNTIVAGNFAGSSTGIRNDIEGAIDAASSNNLIGDGTNMTGITNASQGNQVGSSGSPINPQLGALANNGGTTQTHALLSTSTAIEAGDNANLPADTFDLDGDANTAEALPVDQRGTGFPRVADSADANVIQTVDIGAFELHPSIEDIGNQSTNEDTVKNVTFNIGDDTGSLIATVTATSSNTTLVPNANLSFSGSGGSRNLQITPAANLSGTTTITVTVTATNGRTATDTFDLTVAGVNDPPSGTDNTVSTAEDTAYTFTAADFGFTDPNDSPANTLLAVKITTLPGLGTLTNNNVPVSAGDFIPVANINGGLLKFTPAANGNGTPYTTFTFQVQDNGGGTDLDPTPNTMTINVTAVNDGPVNTVPGPQSTNEDTAKVFSSGNGNQISVADVDAGSNPIKVTLTATNGTLTLSTTAGLVFITGDGTADATMMFTGTLTAVNTALNGMSFTPTANFSGAASLQIISDDQGNTGSGGPLTDTDSVNITVTAANDPPVVTTTAGNLSYTENDPPTAIDPGLTVTDIDSTNLVGATVAITSGFVAAQDTLAFTNQNGITGNYNSGTGVLTLTGTTTLANYQTALRSVTYQNSSDNPTTSRTVTFIADDGSSTSTPATRGITFTAVNDGPVNTVPGTQGTNQNTPLVFSSGNLNQISISDVDAGTNAVQVTLTATNGTITLSGTSGLAFTVGDGTADATMTFTGTLVNINTALNGMTFTPTNGFSGAATLSITTNDLGNTGSGGPLTDTDSVNIQVSTNISIQDAQVVEPPSGTVNMIFTVTLSAPAPAGGISVNFTTQDQAPALNHATAGQDYTTTSGTVSFAAGEQFKTILVPVLADNKNNEVDETFLVNLSNPVNSTIARGTAIGTILITNQPGVILISELRTSGPGGGGDDFVEIYNNSDSPHTVSASDGSGGYGLFKMGADCSATPVLIGVIPNGTVIPARGHYLFVGSAYSLADYGGTGAAAGDQTLTQDIESDHNVAIFSTASLPAISSANRFDAVGFGSNTGGICDLFREGTTLTQLSGSVLEYSYFRDECGKKGNPATFGPCPTGGFNMDTDNNNNDFIFADTQGTVTPAGQRLGAPGPQNLGSPRLNLLIPAPLLDATKGSTAPPNRVRDLTPQLPNAMNGTLSIRRRFVNNTGAPITRLRFRIVDISALASVGGIADLRALTSTSITVTGIADSGTCSSTGTPATPPCTVTVFGTTLETPPNQPSGGAVNSSLNAGTIALPTPLAPGQSINLQFLLGVQQTGSFKFFINIEALP